MNVSRQTEIRNLEYESIRNQHVARGQVAVDALLGAKVLHAARNLTRKRHQLFLGERRFFPVGALVARGWSAFAQKVPQVTVLRKLNDDVERPVLGAHPQQVDDVDVAADHLHHVHLGDEVDHLGVRVSLLQHLDRHDGRLAGALEVHCVCLNDLAEGALAQRASQLKLSARELPVGIQRELVFGDRGEGGVLGAGPQALGGGLSLDPHCRRVNRTP